MYIKRTIKFLLHKRKPGETNNLAIRMRVTLSGQRPIDFPIGHNIDLSHWDMSDFASTYATVDLKELLVELKKQV